MLTHTRSTRAAACAAALCLLAACGGGKTSGNASASASTTTAAPIPLGLDGATDALAFAVADVSTTRQIGPAGVGPSAAPGETFVVVTYGLKNLSDRPLTLFERPAVTLVDPEGRSYAPDALATPVAAGMMDDPSGMAADLNPNVSAVTKAAWKLDAKAFDRKTWRLAVATDPELTFSLAKPAPKRGKGGKA